MEGDKFFLPSIFLAGAEEKRERLFGLFSPEEEMLRKGTTPLSEHIMEVDNIKGSASDSAINVTHIDGYRACPRRFFIEKTLNLAPPELTDYEMEARTLGTIVHEVMEKLIPMPAGDIGSFTDNASRVLQEVLLDRPLDAYFKNLLRETFMDIVPKIYEMEEGIKADGYAFKEAEYALKGEPIDGVRLKGKVDRIDAMPGGEAEVMDYKTGAVDLSGTRVMHKGAALQLFLYAAMLRAQGMRPRRVGIYSLKDMKIKWVPGRNDVKKGLSLEDFINSSLGYLRETVDMIRRGDFTALPLEEQTCRRCHERPYCPYIQRGAPDGGQGSEDA
jgi:RecB family exonuclease